MEETVIHLTRGEGHLFFEYSEEDIAKYGGSGCFLCLDLIQVLLGKKEVGTHVTLTVSTERSEGSVAVEFTYVKSPTGTKMDDGLTNWFATIGTEDFRVSTTQAGLLRRVFDTVIPDHLFMKAAEL